MILLGGIPDIYYNRVLELARKQIKNTEFTGLSLRSYKGQYKIDSPYCEELLATIVAYVEGRPNSLAEGLGVVLLQRDWETQNFDDVFWPFALCRNVRIDQQTSNHGEGRKRAANVYAKHALQAAQKLAGQIRFLSIHVQCSGSAYACFASCSPFRFLPS